MVIRSMLLVMVLAGSGFAQTLSFRGCADVKDPGVQGLSGITRVGGDIYWAVMDNSDRVVQFEIKLGADGSITSAKELAQVRVAERKDFEGIAYTGAAKDSILLSDENPAGITEYHLSDGKKLRAIDIPSVFKHAVRNAGFESLSLSPDGKTLWTANERALTIDGNSMLQAEPIMSTTRVRLQRFDRDGETFRPSGQFLYRTGGVHDWGGQIGLCDLAALPDGRLLALERSAAMNFSKIGSIRTRIFLVDTRNVTDVSGPAFEQGVKDDHTSKEAEKMALFDGFVCDADGENLEGLCLGPSLGAGRWAVLGVVDSTDGLLHVSKSRIVAFELNMNVAATNSTMRPARNSATGNAP
jgi:hypothetical protein